jgi:hypothetical protein
MFPPGKVRLLGSPRTRTRSRRPRIRPAGRLGWSRPAAAVICLSQVAVASAGGGNAANATLCQNGGWQSLLRSDGSSFTSEGDCVSYAALGGTLQGTYPRARADCARSSVTFGSGGPDLVKAGPPGAGVIWVCNGVPGGAPSVQEISFLGTQCSADTDGRGDLVGSVAVREGAPIDITCYDRGGLGQPRPPLTRPGVLHGARLLVRR